MSIDLGSDSTKVAVVLPGIPMEIALDSTSKRSIPTLVFLQEGNRLFGNTAIDGMVKDPKSVFAELPSIVGKTIDHPSVLSYQKRFPYHNLTFNEESGLLTFTLNEKQYTAEELLGMFLEHVRKVAENFSNAPMKTAVIGVQSHFTQAERKAILRAAQLAGIEVLQLMNDNIAIALNFAIRQLKLQEKRPHFLFYDVGASATTVSVVSFEMSKTRVGDHYEEHPHIFIRGVGSDPALGTDVFIDRLLLHLINHFKATRKHVTADVTKNPRAMAKFRKEATRVFRILSANKEIYSMIEAVLDGEDFRMKVSRAELENMCNDLTERFKTPIFHALEMSGTPMHELEDVIIFGGGTRIPMVQKIILETTQKTALGKSINADEAGALGMVYQAASLTPGFRVKQFIVKDITRYPIAVTFKRSPMEGEEEPITNDIYTTRVLFNFGNPYPQKRTITFNRLTTDLDFLVHYGEVHPIMASYLHGVKNLFNVSVTEVLARAKNYTDYVARGVKAHFSMDASGILNLTEVNLIMKPPNETVVSTAPADSSAFQKIADGISNLFKSSSDVASQETTEEASAKETTEAPNITSSVVNTTANPADTNTTAQVKKPTFVQPLPFGVTNLDAIVPTPEQMASSKLVLVKLEKQDEEKHELERTRNLLETVIYANREKLEGSAFINHTTEEERDAVSKVISVVTDWYDEEGYSALKSDLDVQLEKIGNVTAHLDKRVRDYAVLPTLFAEMDEVLNTTESVLMMMKSLQSSLPKLPPKPIVVPAKPLGEEATAATDKENKEREELEKLMTVFTDSEIGLVELIIDENKKWRDEAEATLKSTSPSVDVPVKLEEISSRTTKMFRESGYYMRKAENWKAAMQRAEAEMKRRSEAAAAEANKTKPDDSTTTEAPVESETVAEPSDASTTPNTPEPVTDATTEANTPRLEL